MYSLFILSTVDCLLNNEPSVSAVNNSLSLFILFLFIYFGSYLLGNVLTSLVILIYFFFPESPWKQSGICQGPEWEFLSVSSYDKWIIKTGGKLVGLKYLCSVMFLLQVSTFYNLERTIVCLFNVETNNNLCIYFWPCSKSCWIALQFSGGIHLISSKLFKNNNNKKGS